MKKILTLPILPLASAAGAGDIEDGLAAYDKKDYATAIQKFKAAGINGNAIAQFIVGAMSDIGRGVVQNSAEAVKWYKLAAAQGDAGAQLNFGNLFSVPS